MCHDFMIRQGLGLHRSQCGSVGRSRPLGTADSQGGGYFGTGIHRRVSGVSDSTRVSFSGLRT
jgi:hypothetical protein